jgi:hypothetical protein
MGWKWSPAFLWFTKSMKGVRVFPHRLHERVCATLKAHCNSQCHRSRWVGVAAPNTSGWAINTCGTKGAQERATQGRGERPTATRYRRRVAHSAAYVMCGGTTKAEHGRRRVGPETDTHNEPTRRQQGGCETHARDPVAQFQGGWQQCRNMNADAHTLKLPTRRGRPASRKLALAAQ